MRCVFSLFLFLMSSLLSAGELWASAPRIAEITVKGAKKTDAGMIKQMSKLRPEQEVTSHLLESARLQVLRQGVFDEVSVNSRSSSRPNYVDIEIEVKEKISWFVIPYMSYSKGNFSLGGAVGETNFAGRFKKILGFGDWGPETRRGLVAYRDPNLAGSNFTMAMDLAIRRENMRAYDKDRSENRRVRLFEAGATLLLGYRWSENFGVELGPFYRNVSHRQVFPEVNSAEDRDLRPVDLRNGNDISLMLKLTYDNRDFKEGFSSGSRVEFESQVSDNRFGSKFDYYRQILRIHQSYFLVPEFLNIKHDFSMQLGLTLPFYRELMMGGTNLRGFVETQFRGDTRYSLSNEIWFPLIEFKMIVARGVTFWDSGILYFKDQKFTRESWNNGFGGGLRFYVKGINIPVLGWDLAYGAEDKAIGTYLQIGAAF